MDYSNDNTYYGEQFEEDSSSRPQLSVLAADYSDQYDDDNFEDDSNVQDKDRVSRRPIIDYDDYYMIILKKNLMLYLLFI